MKLGKLSLVAVMALGTSAYAIENVKVSGEVKVIYQTSDVEKYASDAAGATTGMFDNGNNPSIIGVSPYNGASAGGIGGTIGVTADLLKNVSAGAEVQIYTTLGLDQNVFNDNMINAPFYETGFTNGTTAPGSTYEDRTDDASNISQMWLATTVGKTTLKAGRMELDTPLLFTEKWNVAKNTFEAAVAINNDLPDTTLVGAWVGKHNGHGAAYSATGNEGGFLLAGSPGRTVNMESFRSIGAYDQANGAYAAGAVNKSIPNTTIQAWYYNVVQAAEAYWLQADTKVAGMVTLGFQYANMDPKLASLPTLKDSSIWAVKAGVDVAGVNLYAAYSKSDKDGTLGFSNVSTADKTNIYTGQNSIYFDGVVTGPGIETIKVGASTSIMGANVAAAYVKADGGDNAVISQNGAVSGEVDGFDFSISGKAGPIGLQAIYTMISNDTNPTVLPGAGNAFYKGRDIDTLRLIASLKF
jgi:imipenem/basic amino acid-specific outer membrane pore